MELEAIDCQLLVPGHRRARVDELDGWGRGLYGECAALYEMHSRGGSNSRTIEAVVQGDGVLNVSIGNRRCGWIHQKIEISRDRTISRCSKIGQATFENFPQRSYT